MLMQLRVVFSDGTEQLVVSDGSWRASNGPIIRDGIRNGEAYDARLEMPRRASRFNWKELAFHSKVGHSGMK